MLEATRTECDATNNRIFAEQMDDNFPTFRIIDIERGAHMIHFYVKFDIFNQ